MIDEPSRTLAGSLPTPDEQTARRLLVKLRPAASAESPRGSERLRFPHGPSLRAARIAAGMSVEQVAISVGRTAYSISGYERGKIEPPLHVLVQMCEMFGTTVGAVLSEVE